MTSNRKHITWIVYKCTTFYHFYSSLIALRLCDVIWNCVKRFWAPISWRDLQTLLHWWFYIHNSQLPVSLAMKLVKHQSSYWACLLSACWHWRTWEENQCHCCSLFSWNTGTKWYLNHFIKQHTHFLIMIIRRKGEALEKGAHDKVKEKNSILNTQRV